MGLGGRVVKRPELSGEATLAAPEGTHQPDRLVGAPASPLKWDTDELELVPMPTHPDPEREPPPGEVLQRRNLLGEEHRVVQGDEDDRSAESDSFRPTRDPRERHEWRVHTPVGIDRVGADDDVLRRPDGVESELGCGRGDASDAVGSRIPPVVGQDDAEMHDPRLMAARVARLATTDADGRPHLVPIVFALAGDTLYSAVDRKPKRSQKLRRIENARARPDVTILVDNYEEEWDRLWWIRLRGRARVLDAGDERERALTLLAAKYPQYVDEPPDGPVLAVDVTEIRSWSAIGKNGGAPSVK